MWYLLQTVIVVGVTYLYTEVIPNKALPGHILLFAILCAYAATWVISKAFDCLRILIRWAKKTKQ
jgi:hypothetical protein